MIIEDIKNIFTRQKLTRDFLLILACTAFGIVLFIAMALFTKIPAKGGELYFLLQNLGYFFLCSGIFLGYAAVHRGNIAPGESARTILFYTVKKLHVILGILLGSLVALLIIALVELIPVFLGYIPYAGPVIVAILTVPYFIINFAMMSAVVFIWIIMPPMIAEGTGLKRMPLDYYTLVRKRGLVILAYTMLAILVMAIIFIPVLMAIRYSAGITRAVQWNINPTYPQMLKAVIRPSYITDIVTKIAPRTDPVATLQQYGSSLFNYIEMLGTFLKVLYGIMLAAIVSFMGVIFTNILSLAYTRIRKDVLK